MEKTKLSDEIREFIGVAYDQWASLMSGKSSILPGLVLIILGVFNFIISTFFGWIYTALVLLLITAFQVWKKEKDEKTAKQLEIDSLEDLLRPKLHLSFDPKDFDGCVVFAPRETPSIKNFRLRVRTDGGRLTGCRGFIKSISGANSFSGEQLTLTFAPSHYPDSTNKTIDPGPGELLDILTISNQNLVRFHTLGLDTPNHLNPAFFFQKLGEFIFEISVRCNEVDGATQTCKLRFKWLGQWEDAEMEMIP